MGRPKKVNVEKALPVPEPVVAFEPSPATEAGLFDDLPEPVGDIPMVRPDDGIPPLDTDLTVDEKQEFIKLLNSEIPIAVRAHQLAKLARMTGSKTAAVGLRALQEINSVCGLSSDKPREAGPMFVLPAGSKIAILVDKSDK